MSGANPTFRDPDSLYCNRRYAQRNIVHFEPPRPAKIECGQCLNRVTGEQAAACKSPFCKAKNA